jgi:hypothetical protein
MILDRRNILKALPVAASAALANPSLLATPKASSVKLTLEPASATAFRPLLNATLHIAGSGWENATAVIVDGAGREYVREKTSSTFKFTIGGALGRQIARVVDKNGATIGELSFLVDCSTELNDEGGVYRDLLKAVLWTMMSWSQDNPVFAIHYKDRAYQCFANWIFDHTLILKGMKYFWPNVKDAIDFFADTQREDGMIWENCYPATPDLNFFDWKFDYDGFIKRFGDGFWQLRRAPVESHVEQYFVEGLYSTWKATGDNDWMKGKLDNAIRALRQITKSPYRWSEKYQLMHRGFTIDTWDYVSDDQQRFGGSVFMVYLGKSEFGVFHGDNTNLVFQSRNLAEMLKVSGRGKEAPEFEKLADDVEKRLGALAWNGNFYTHWIAENLDYKPDVGVDMSSQVSLSNAYALNRGISHDKCVSVIKTYQRIKREMPSSSPGEFYAIYPPFQRDFTLNVPGLVWEYCNGGILTVVAGELAHGAFEHGFEAYGADILRRVKAIADRYRGYLPCTLRGKAAETPQRTFRQLSIREQANASHGKNAAGVPLWTEAELNLADLLIGTHELQGVPFEVLSPAQSPFRSCIVLSRQSPYPQSITLVAGAKAASIYLLNAADGRAAAGMLLTMHYADGTSHTEDVAGHGWSFPTDSKYATAGPRTEDTYRVAWKKSTPEGQEAGVYATGINNPHPDREISSLELICCGAKDKWLVLAVTLSSSPVFFAPYDDLSTGIPDGWTGSVIYALLEGLAGVKDQGAAFSRTELTPRWESANVPTAEVTVRYPASSGYCSYKYRANQHKVEVEFTGSAESFDVQVLLPPNRQARKAGLDGHDIETTKRKVEESSYLVLPAIQSGVHRLEVELV